MGINVGNYLFENPTSDIFRLENKPGVYIVLDGNDHSRVIDVGSSKDVKGRIQNHDRKWQWQKYALSFAYAVKYCDPALKVGIESRVRDSLNPLCGEQ